MPGETEVRGRLQKPPWEASPGGEQTSAGADLTFDRSQVSPEVLLQPRAFGL